MNSISMTLILIVMTVFISYRAFNSALIQQKLLFHPVSVKDRGEWYRFLTHGFVHANWEHLLINMYVLYIFGEQIEFKFMEIFGPNLSRVFFLILYLSAVIIAAIPSYINHADNPLYRSVGASGATSALVFTFIFFAPWAWFLIPPLPAIIFGVAYLWYSSYMSKKGMDNIGHDAHFWGGVYGFVFTLFAVRAFKPEALVAFWNDLIAGPGGLPF